MHLKKWDELPEFMRTNAVREYYDILSKKKVSLVLKRIFDIAASFLMLIILCPVMLVIAVMIKLDSKGPVFFRQERITRYGRVFRIYKFRTMVDRADKLGSLVTVEHDSRITRVGKMLRKIRLDELPQLINVLNGDMTFVGTRPEVKRYVDAYTDEMNATLLLPAGITSQASIKYKDEDELLAGADDIDKVYIEKVLPGKMRYNLESIRKFSFISELATMVQTVLAVF
ncbi:MAG: sugar transferase [Clostridia bacterium]|nr:sugar transferase [Clostridia bacterium]